MHLLLLIYTTFTFFIIYHTYCHCQYINQSPNEVVKVDFRLNDNLQRHHTNQYKQITHPTPYNPIGPSIVLRRGEQFNIVIHLRQFYNKNNDKIRLEFSFGTNPQLDKGTLIYLPVEADVDHTEETSKWNAQVTHIVGNQLSIQINLPASIAIGVWHFKISTKVAGTRRLHTYIVSDTLYMLFNAWNKDDAVYLAREDARQEYVLNEVGKIYVGSHASSCGRKWTYGQFHEAVLPAVMLLLDRTRLDVNDRADVVKVSRAVSALVNIQDDNGLLVGNWSGTYGTGLAPWQWTGSPPIFEKYLQTGRPVKFAQCWVYGGVTTTVLRTLGIPARTVTNFFSAHDTDFSLTMDKFFSERGEQIDGVNTDSVWNFHVWSDAWMARYDLPPGYHGWQAIDGTPQEVSGGAYQLGPASLQAIKEGKVGFAYDVGFVFSEVNADVVHWRLDSRSQWQWRKHYVDKSHIGRKMLTKMIGIFDQRSVCGDKDAENIVNQYKHIEGSKEERIAYMEAAGSAGLTPILNDS